MEETVVIGAGLAGTAIGLELLRRKRPFLLIDDHRRHSSSVVAPGFYHGLAIRQIGLSFKAVELLPFSRKWYDAFDTSFGVRTHFPRRLYRVFGAQEERRIWSEKAMLPDYDTILGDQFPPDFIPRMKANWGYGEILQAGNVDVPLFLGTAWHTFQRDASVLLNKVVQIQSKRGHLELTLATGEKIMAENVIQAGGHLPEAEYGFEYLPTIPVKGEVLTVRLPELQLRDAVTGGVLFIPQGEDVYTIASTYDREDTTYKTTQKARDELLEKLKARTDIEPHIISQIAGRRPTVRDRRPLLGEHPEIKNLFILNGLGSKGVLLAPYFAQMLVHSIFDNLPADPEVSIQRFSKLYGHSKN